MQHHYSILINMILMANNLKIIMGKFTLENLKKILKIYCRENRRNKDKFEHFKLFFKVTLKLT